MRVLIHTNKQAKISMTLVGHQPSCWDTPFVLYRNFDLLISMCEYSHGLPISKCYMILRMTDNCLVGPFSLENHFTAKFTHFICVKYS